jgi:hypothetical protein
MKHVRWLNMFGLYFKFSNIYMKKYHGDDLAKEGEKVGIIVSSRIMSNDGLAKEGEKVGIIVSSRIMSNE